MKLQPKGELLAWGLFGGFALVGWVWTMFIRGGKLESDDYVGDDGDGAESDGEENDEDHEEYEQRQDISGRLRRRDDNGRAISDIEE